MSTRVEQGGGRSGRYFIEVENSTTFFVSLEEVRESLWKENGVAVDLRNKIKSVVNGGDAHLGLRRKGK